MLLVNVYYQILIVFSLTKFHELCFQGFMSQSNTMRHLLILCLMKMAGKSISEIWLVGREVCFLLQILIFSQSLIISCLDGIEPFVKKQKTKYSYHTTENVIEEMSKNCVHPLMVCKYR